MTNNGYLIPLSDRQAWKEALSGIDHAFAHSWDSCQAMQLTTRWPTFLYCYTNVQTRFVCPIAVREFHGALDVVTPYGFGGFAGHGDTAELLGAWARFARDQGYVCGYFALNPLLVRDSFDGAEGLVLLNELFFLDLSWSENALLAAMKRNRRRSITRREQNGSPFVTDKALLTAFFLSEFDAFMRSRGASETYRFSIDTLRALIDAPNSILIGAAGDSQLEAVALFCHSDIIGEAMFSIARPAGNQHTDVLMWAGARALKCRNVRWLSLGGGISRHDSVAVLKGGYGGMSVRMPTLRQVYDHARFVRLCENAGFKPAIEVGFFPPYHEKSSNVR